MAVSSSCLGSRFLQARYFPDAVECSRGEGLRRVRLPSGECLVDTLTDYNSLGPKCVPCNHAQSDDDRRNNKSQFLHGDTSRASTCKARSVEEPCRNMQRLLLAWFSFAQ